jgi:transcription antitermination factor NusG
MKPKETELKWYVLYTRPKFEKKICEEIDYLKFENYLPLQTVIRRWSDRIKKIEEPLFAGYVFVKKGPRQGWDLLQIPGVIRFVSTGNSPDTISEGEIHKIKLIEAEGRDIQKEDFYTTGDEVMIKQGVFAGMKGMLVRNINQQPRFLIRLPLLKQAISVEVSVNDLMKVGSAVHC